MLKRFRQLLVALIIVLLAVYIVVTNSQSVTVTIWGTAYSAAAGVVLLAAFAVGVLLTATVGLFFGFIAYLRELRLERRERERLAFYEGMVEARSYLASEEWSRARVAWQKIVRKDPTHTIARIELSRSIQGEGDLHEALRTLDEARAAAPNNVEVLFRAAELNLALNNRTAALDNLALILYHQPNKRAARLARDLSEELGRIEDAFEYQAKIEALGEAEPDTDKIRSRLQFHKLLRDAARDAAGAAAFEAELREFVRKHDSYVPALEKLAALELAAEKNDAAVQLLIKAAKLIGSEAAWHQVSLIWIASKTPDKAIFTAKAAARELHGVGRLHVELELIHLYASFNMIDEAMRSISTFADLAKSEGVAMEGNIERRYLLLKGFCFSLRNENREALLVWKRLCSEEQRSLPSLSRATLGPATSPGPNLSTP